MMKKRITLICLSALMVFSHSNIMLYAADGKHTEYSIAIGSYELYGRLTMPYGIENPPVAILIHGSGQGNYNSAFGGMTRFYDIAHGLARQGVATIRFNKRYRQHPPLPPDATIWDETIYDVFYAIDFALNHGGLGDIFLVGFSQGGIVAPHIAYARPEVAGIVSLAGSPRGFFEIVASQNEFLHHNAAAHGMNIPSFIQADWLLRWLLAVDETAYPEAFGQFNAIAAALGFPISFMRSMYGLSTPDIINYVQIPFLILQGDKDLQIFAAYDFTAWKYLLYGRENVTFILYEGLNHFFTPHVPELGFNQSRARANVDAQVISDIAEWILQNP